MLVMSSEQDKIKILVKTHTRNEEFFVRGLATVAEIKPEIAERFQTEVNQLCLIYAGRPLKDTHSLNDQNVKDGFAIHLVIRQPNVQPPSQSPTPPNPQRNTMDDITANLINNPEYIRTLINMDPRLQGYLEQNPEISHVINNPSLMREYLQMAANPNMMQEFLRGQDLTLRHIENTPGGFAALQSLYNNLSDMESNTQPEPQTDSTPNSQPPPNPTLNTNPLPNPWSTDQTTDQNNSQFLPQPELIAQMLANPQIQQIMRNLASDPNFLRTILSNNPTLGDPSLQEYLTQNLSSVLGYEGNGLEEDTGNLVLPEVRYSSQLEQLSSMGFGNREDNLRALVSSLGDINAAIDILTRNL